MTDAGSCRPSDARAVVRSAGPLLDKLHIDPESSGSNGSRAEQNIDDKVANPLTWPSSGLFSAQSKSAFRGAPCLGKVCSLHRCNLCRWDSWGELSTSGEISACGGEPPGPNGSRRLRAHRLPLLFLAAQDLESRMPYSQCTASPVI